MRDSKILIAAALALSVATLAIGQSGGGFPSRPKFQNVTISSPDNTAAFSINDTGTAVSGIYAGFAHGGTLKGVIGTGGVLGAGCSLGDFCFGTGSVTSLIDIKQTGAVTFAGASTGTLLTLNVSTAADQNLVLNNSGASGPYMSLTNGGNVVAYLGSTTNIAGQGAVTDFGIRAGTGSNIDFWAAGHATATPDIQINTAGALLQAGVRVPKMAFGTIGGIGSCAVGGTTQGMSSCTRPSTGFYNVVLTGFSAAPVCTSIPTTGLAVSWTTYAVGASSILATAQSYSANVLTDIASNALNLVCVGI